MTQHRLLSAETHRDLRVRTDAAANPASAVMSSVIVPDEFRQVQNDYPILFRLNAERDQFTAVALFGFEPGENLFLDGSDWDAPHRPLAMGIQPFLIGARADEAGDKQVHIDMASPLIANDGMRVFDDDGRATPYLEAIAERLGALDAGLQGADAFFDALRRHELLEPLTLEVTLEDGSTNRLVGFHVIDEDRLRLLDGAGLHDLHAGDHLMPVFMALASIANFGKLVVRKNRRMGHG